jgi:hypothetical protein
MTTYPGTDTIIPDDLVAATEALDAYCASVGCDSSQFRMIVMDATTRGGAASKMTRVVRREFCAPNLNTVSIELQDYLEARMCAEAAMAADLYGTDRHHTEIHLVTRRVHRMAIEAGRSAA